MTGLLIFNTASFTALSLPTQPTTIHASFRPPQQLPTSPATRISVAGDLDVRKTRGSTVVRRAGPNSGSYIFAFVFPLSLLAATIFTSIKIADKLDRDFLEDLAVNEAITQAEDGEDGDDGDDGISIKEPEPALPRTRNRPKREA